MSAHKDIGKKFKVRDRNGQVHRFEGVGFLNEGESWIYGDEMLRRVPDAISEADAKLLDECVDQDWSEDIWPYYLVTAWCNPGSPCLVVCFGRRDDGWNRLWFSLDFRWDGDVLVVRRCA